MRKCFTKIICFTAAAIVALGIMLFAACGKTYDAKPVSPDNINDSAVTSNGGFAVQKGDYIYFINGSEAYTASNTFGDVVKGAIMRISKDDLSKRNYSSVDTIVPLVVYSGNSNAGIYIYGDRIYYTTPSTEKNSDGEVLNSYLQFKSTKLDGTGTQKDYLLQLSDNATEYRYVEVDGTVYILYVISEDLYGSTCKNLRSYNTESGEDTILAYNVSDVTFDKKDVTNPRVYYTMNVTDYVTNTSYSNYYNQIYTVSADATTPNDYKLGEIIDDYDADENPLYINYGKLVFDGIGKVQSVNVTPFNGEGADKVERSAYKYTVSSYEDGYLYYTRTSAQNETAMLFAQKQTEVLADGWQPVSGNPQEDDCLKRNGSDAANYIYRYNGDALTGVIVTGSDGLKKMSLADGKIPDAVDNVNSYYLTTDGQATYLFTEQHDGKNYIYYSLTGGNGYTVYRICIDGSYADYNSLSVTDEYKPVRVLDVDSLSNWYKPEMFENQLLFAGQTADMVNYPYIMVCDLRKDGKMRTNAELKELNEQYEGIEEAIAETDEAIYENLPNALRYAFYTGESEYIGELIKAYMDIEGRDEEYFWSKQSVEKYHAFIAASADGEWSEYSATVKVNGKDVAANKRDYYYSVLGKMTGGDYEDYLKELQDKYLQTYPEEAQEGWFDGLSKGAKAGVIIGIIAACLAVVAAVTVTVVVLVRKHKKKLPVYKKKRIKVDTTDDKNIDVYASDDETRNE